MKENRVSLHGGALLLEKETTPRTRDGVDGDRARHDLGAASKGRVTAPGKYLMSDGEKFWLRGVTYGTFRPREKECIQFPDQETVARDFALMQTHGINTVRTYTVPPRWLLDLAYQYQLRLMVGIPWEQHIAFLDDGFRARRIECEIQETIDQYRRHPAVLCYSIGNEIPASIVRWHGRTAIESFLKRLYQAGKESDPTSLITYVNFPTTEYLNLSFLDLFCFNVYLEEERALDSYIARLHNLAGDRPVILAEVGLDSRRNGTDRQAHTLGWQLRSIYRSGCAGAFVFSWTDEWYRGGFDIEDWDFGLITRERGAKPALQAVEQVFRGESAVRHHGPKVSIVVCTYNGSRTIKRCLDGLMTLNYKNYEVIVIDDGSTDTAAEIARQYPVRLIQTENRGLSSARNTGFRAASGAIVAYIDDDAWPDRDWLSYLVQAFEETDHAGIGGPNIPPPEDNIIAQCVANAPGGPVHVLLSDRVAEHVPGCNMAFRKSCLASIGGFDEQYRAAGDDVDICWRIQEQGWTLGFHPGAMVWHHRRPSIRAYLKQQRGYGKAEALLERKWPQKYNGSGSARWHGRIYGLGLITALGMRQRIYHGAGGSALFRSLYEPALSVWQALPMMPEWNLLIASAAILSLCGTLWSPLWLFALLAAVGMGLSIAQAVQGARRARFHQYLTCRRAQLCRQGLTGLLYLLQPIARLAGRINGGLSPVRRYGRHRPSVPRKKELRFWNETWQAPEDLLRQVEATIRARRAMIMPGGDFDAWDLEIRLGLFGKIRMLLGIEEHGAGKQMVLIRLLPRHSIIVTAVAAAVSCFGITAALEGAYVAATVLMIMAALPVLKMLYELGASTAMVCDSVQAMWNDRRRSG